MLALAQRRGRQLVVAVRVDGCQRQDGGLVGVVERDDRSKLRRAGNRQGLFLRDVVDLRDAGVQVVVERRRARLGGLYGIDRDRQRVRRVARIAGRIAGNHKHVVRAVREQPGGGTVVDLNAVDAVLARGRCSEDCVVAVVERHRRAGGGDAGHGGFVGVGEVIGCVEAGVGTGREPWRSGRGELGHSGLL